MEILLFFKVNVCQQVCIAEVRKVLACPISGQDWINFSKLKNCSSRNHVCSSFVPLKYHCLPNAFRNETFEMCATDADIIGTYSMHINTFEQLTDYNC